MSLLLKNILETLALMGATCSISLWPLRVPLIEPTGGMLVLCGFLLAFFIVQQRLRSVRESR